MTMCIGKGFLAMKRLSRFFYLMSWTSFGRSSNDEMSLLTYFRGKNPYIKISIPKKHELIKNKWNTGDFVIVVSCQFLFLKNKGDKN